MKINGKKKISRKEPSEKMDDYFSEATQESIKDFLKASSQEEREKIYKEKIYPAFNSLTQNLIYVYKFNSPNHSIELLKQEAISFLFEVLHKFDPEKGSKAFSYFNVVAKNWFIITTKKNIEFSRKHVSLDHDDDLSPEIKNEIYENNILLSPDELSIKSEKRNDVLEIIRQMKMKKISGNELLCLNAIETLFLTINTIEFFNKRAVLFYLKDLSGLSKKELSKCLIKLKKNYKKTNKMFMNENN